MSTIPTEITAATEGSLDIASIKSVMDGFDPASLLPDLSKVFGSLVGVCRVAVMIGPVIALILGLAYLFLAPKEANYYFGYRCYFGMGSVRAWRFTQRIAGMILGGLGLQSMPRFQILIPVFIFGLQRGNLRIAMLSENF